MVDGDNRAAFLQTPWAVSLLKGHNIVYRVPGSRRPKPDLEDSLFAETLNTSRTLQSCICIYQHPKDGSEKIEEVSTLFTVGNGLNGHSDTMHGGIVASILDEGMGILQSVNHERDHLSNVGKGLAIGELPSQGLGSYTATLNIKYRSPVRTPGTLLVTARYVKIEGRKEWMEAVVKQRVVHGLHGDDDGGEEVICATGEALFVKPNRKTSKI